MGAERTENLSRRRGLGGLIRNLIGDCETGLVFDVQKRQMPDFVGDK